MISLDKAQSSDFLPYLNQIFYIRLNDNDPIELELVGVEQNGREYSLTDRQPFSLHFLGSASTQYLVQHIYRLEHEQLGVFDLFLVPLGPEAEHMRYEAVFN